MHNSRTTYKYQVHHRKDASQPESSAPVNTNPSSYFDSQFPDSLGGLLSIALIGPDEEKRKALAHAIEVCRGGDVREFSSYPPALDDVPKLLEQFYDAIIIDLDSNPEYALEIMENICAKDSATVMVYSAKADRELMLRCMRAGAREYLVPPFDQSTIAEALVRAAAAVHQTNRPVKKTRGKLLAFLGVKGGSGVTTVACNFAVALAQESGQSTVLVDLGLPLGDAALNFGIVSEYSTDNALLDAARLDANLLTKLLVKHRSGVSLLAAPSQIPKVEATAPAIDKLMAVARQEFDNVVVDLGSRLDLIGTSVFKEATTVYLVTQAGISELRNANRLISQFFNAATPKLEVVVNRFEARSFGLSDDQIAKALTRPAQWKIPNDYAAARQMQNTATPLMLEDSPISRLIRQMARSICGLPANAGNKAGFSLSDLSRRITEKIFLAHESPSITEDAPSSSEEIASGSEEMPVIAWPPPAPICYGTPLSSNQLNADASVSGSFAYTPGPGYVLAAGTYTLWVTFTPANTTQYATVQSAASITVTKATPTLKWPTPPAIPCGRPLGSEHLNATSTAPGTFVYSPTAGEVLAPGKHTLSVTFKPKDTTNYESAQASVEVTVAKSTPALAWATPAPMTCGVPLSHAQLNAEASVHGLFVYSPAAGEALRAGNHTLSVTFIPSDVEGFEKAQGSVQVTVAKGTPSIAWPTPAAITYGTPLSAAQLAATASVPGTFAYVPGEGAVLAAGTHYPLVTFTPADPNDYNMAQAAVSLTVVKATPSITWPTPAPITESTPLSGAQLNAAASIPGVFVYDPAAGQLLTAGRQTLSVTFTPADSTNFNTVQASVSLNVTRKALTSLTWTPPSPISYGSPLGAAQLNAAASVPGKFVYTPAAGDVLAAGRHTLSVIFTPEDTTENTPAHATVPLVVEGLQNIASLLTAATHEPFSPTMEIPTPAAPEPAPAPAPAFAERQSGQHETYAPTETRGFAEHMKGTNGTRDAYQTESVPNHKPEPERRTYKGATYEKGEDGQWHLRQN
jgi:Flp pilus assembly CpaE family ATPase